MRSLRLKLLLVTVAVQTVVVLALIVSTYRSFHDELLADIRHVARTAELLLATAVGPLIVEKDYAALREIVGQSMDVIGMSYLAVYDADGRPLASKGALPHPGITATGADDETLAAVDGAFHITGPIAIGDQTYGSVRFGIPTQRLLDEQRRMLLRLAAVGSVGLAVSAGLLLVFTGVLTRNLRRLSEAVARIGAGQHDIAVAVHGRDEVAGLATAFNEMSRALAERMTALRESEARQRTLVDAMAEGVVILDESGKVLACNEAAAQILGVARDELFAADTIEGCGPVVDRSGRAIDAENRPSLRALRTGKPQRDVVLGLPRPGGATAWLSVNSMPLVRPGDDRPHATVTSFSDITTRIEAEARLQRMNAELEERVAARTRELVTALEAAERASRAKSEFLSRMSHELRTPLNAILGFAQVLQLKADALPAHAHEQLRQIEGAGWHLLELINEVLDLSRIESGTMTVSREPVDVAPLVTECARMAEPLARRHDVQIVNRAADGQGLHALGDRTRLKQVLTNLLSNAIKYNRAGGSVTLTLARGTDQWIEIAVADTGRGFTEEQLGQLFQPFNRLGAETGPVDGTGIGLVITKRLVELMGGVLQVRTSAGTGSVFTVRLPPAQRGEAVAPAPARQTSAADGVHTVLYIEDNPSNVDLLAGVLTLRPGVKLVTAADGASGLAAARRERPDLIVVDVALPDIDGFEVCRQLRAEAAFARAPIVALSANAMPGDIEKGRHAGFDAYLTKPLEVPTFLAELDRLLGQGEALR